MLCFFVFILLIGTVSCNKQPFGEKIVGGTAASILEYPHQLSLQFRTPGSHFCGAALILPDVALTAAHCVFEQKARNLRVYAGTSNTFGGVKREVDYFIVHPKYNNETVDYDLAIIKLESNFPLSATINTVALPSHNDVLPAGTPAIVTGWGYTSENGDMPLILQKVEIPVVSFAKCKALYAGVQRITSRMLCAGFPQGGYDACQGDSGGPLVARGKLVGIVSWGYGCARPLHPGVYTNVARLRKWIGYYMNLKNKATTFIRPTWWLLAIPFFLQTTWFLIT